MRKIEKLNFNVLEPNTPKASYTYPDGQQLMDKINEIVDVLNSLRESSVIENFLSSRLVVPENYERDHSHTHCWLQGKAPACGQPLEKHTQCCLCDTKYIEEPDWNQPDYPPSPSQWEIEFKDKIKPICDGYDEWTVEHGYATTGTSDVVKHFISNLLKTTQEEYVRKMEELPITFIEGRRTWAKKVISRSDAIQIIKGE